MDYLVTILCAVLSVLATLATCIIENNTTRKKHDQEFLASHNKSLEDIKNDYRKGLQEMKQQIGEIKASNAQTVAVINLKLDALEKKQDKHNSVIERTYALEKDVSIINEQIKVANHRIEDAEKILAKGV